MSLSPFFIVVMPILMLVSLKILIPKTLLAVSLTRFANDLLLISSGVLNKLKRFKNDDIKTIEK